MTYAEEPHSSGLWVLALMFGLGLFFVLGLPVIATVGNFGGLEGLGGLDQFVAVPRTGVWVADDVARRMPVAGRPMWPVEGTITDGFGWRIAPDTHEPEFHTGIDIGADKGAPILAAAAGVVVFAGRSGDYGDLVKIQHRDTGGTYETWYGHQSEIDVAVGQTVAAGQIIGKVGSTGRSTGNHLHVEYRVAGQPVDPHRLFSQ